MARKGKLDEVEHWPAVAKDSNYDVAEAARRFGTSKRWLEQFLKSKFGQTPLKLFTLWMCEDVREMKTTGMKGKEMLKKTGYSDVSSLSRALINATGNGLRRQRERPK